MHFLTGVSGSSLGVFRDNGVFVVPIVYPAVSRKACRFRFTVMASHTQSDMDFVLGVVEKAMRTAHFTFQSEPATDEARSRSTIQPAA